MSLTLTNTKGGNFDPHPEGIHPAVCIDVLDQGLLPSTFNGKTTLKPKIKLVFESEALLPTGVRATVSKSVTASLAPKSNLAAILGKWRGRPVGDNEQIDLDKLLGACCTLVISHAPSADGTKVYANIDEISKPTKKVVPSGTYDGVAARQRFAEWKAKQRGENGGSRIEDGSAARGGSATGNRSTEAAQQHRPG